MELGLDLLTSLLLVIELTQFFLTLPGPPRQDTQGMEGFVCCGHRTESLS